MPKLPTNIKGRDLIKILEKSGFVQLVEKVVMFV